MVCFTENEKIKGAWRERRDEYIKTKNFLAFISCFYQAIGGSPGNESWFWNFCTEDIIKISIGGFTPLKAFLKFMSTEVLKFGLYFVEYRHW